MSDSWSLVRKKTLKILENNQKLNHFPWSYHLGRKDQLYRNYQIQEELFPSDYNFMVKTFIFPYDAKKFEVHKNTSISPQTKKKLWIFKPSASSWGRGIKVIDSKTEIPENSKGFLISEYIQNPHLIKGFKYDLRIYVLVTNFDPLTVYIYNDGLIRFCTVKYKHDDSNINNKLMHISNYSIQKESQKYKHNNDASEDSSKWNFTMWEEAIREQGHDVKIAQLKIEDLVIKTLIGVQDTISTAYDSITGIRNAWFELYGFDIMFDDHMNPWLLEINTNPSLSSNSTLDKMLKTKLAWDMLTLVGIKILSFSELRITEKKEGKAPLRVNDYEGWETHEDRNRWRTKLMNSINFKNLSEEDIDIILTLEEEYKRMGNFRRIFPNKNNFRDYTKYFYKHSYNNLLVWKYLKANKFDLNHFIDKKYL